MNWTGESRFTFEQFMSLPELSHYLEGWPRPGDFGVVAETTEGTPGARPGAASLLSTMPGGFVAPDIPD
jgi:hypothetical protein